MDGWLKNFAANIDSWSSEACNPLFSCRVCNKKSKYAVSLNRSHYPTDASKDVWKRPGFHRDGDARKNSNHSASSASTKQNKEYSYNSLTGKVLQLSDPVGKVNAPTPGVGFVGITDVCRFQVEIWTDQQWKFDGDVEYSNMESTTSSSPDIGAAAPPPSPVPTESTNDESNQRTFFA